MVLEISMFNSHDFNHFHFLDKTKSKISKHYETIVDFSLFMKQLINQLHNFKELNCKLFLDNKIIFENTNHNDSTIYVFYIFSENFNFIPIHLNHSQLNIVHYTFNFNKNSIQYIIDLNNQQYLNYSHNFLDELLIIDYQYNITNHVNCYFYQNMRNHQLKNKFLFNLTEKSNLQTNYLSHITKKQFHDDSIEINHANESVSNIIYHSISDGILNCQVNSVINKTSNNCETHQKLKHLALSNTAIINAKPNLMISNPNTIASHGNSIGNIDASTLFYLRQKGLNKDQAIAIIITSLKNQFFENFSNNFNTSIFMKWTQS